MSLRLVCVDDDRVNALLFEQVCLQVGGLEIRCAETGAEAEVLVAEWRPDLLVIDLHLPDTDGFALLPRLREASGAPAPRAVLYTAEDPADVATRAARAGFDQTWSKPVEIDELRAALRELLSR